MHTAAFLDGYMAKEAKDESKVGQPTVKDLLNRSRNKRSIFWNAMRDGGRLEALGEAADKDVSFNVRHPILSDIGVSLAGTTAGSIAGRHVGDFFGGYSSKLLGQTLGGGLGGLLAVLAIRKARQGEVEAIGDAGARVDPERIKNTLKKIGGGHTLTRGARNTLLPGLGINEGGYTEMAEAMSNPSSGFKKSKGESYMTGLGNIPTIPTALLGRLVGLGTGVSQGHGAMKKARRLTGDDADTKFRNKVQNALAQVDEG